MYRIILTAITLFAVESAASAQNATGLKTSLAVDLVGELAATKNTEASDKLEVRSADLLFYAPVDHLFSGTLAIAAHQEDDKSVIELHEAHISSDKLLPGLKVKLGQFALGVGRLNRFHRHEWAFTSTPKVQSEFFGDEGLYDTGLEFSYLAPLPFYLDITTGVGNGFTFGHSHDEHGHEEEDHDEDHDEEEEGHDHEEEEEHSEEEEEAHSESEKPRKPTVYIHLKSFFSAGDVDIQPGLSYLQRVSADDDKTQIYGFDLTAKKRNGKILQFLLQSETWHRIVTDHDGDRVFTTGSYLYPEYGFDNGVSLGLRLDYFTQNNLKDDDGENIKNHTTQITPTLSYKPSEFSRFSLSFEAKEEKLGDDTVESSIFKIQSTFVLGEHPSHDF